MHAALVAAVMCGLGWFSVGCSAEEEPWVVRPPTGGGGSPDARSGVDAQAGLDAADGDGGMIDAGSVDGGPTGCDPLGTQPIVGRVLGQLCPVADLGRPSACANDCRHADVPMSCGIPLGASGRTNANGQFLFPDTISLPSNCSAGGGVPFARTRSRVVGTDNPVPIPTVYDATLTALVGDLGLPLTGERVLLVARVLDGGAPVANVTATAESGVASPIYYADPAGWRSTGTTSNLGVVIAVVDAPGTISFAASDGRTATTTASVWVAGQISIEIRDVTLP